MAKEKPPVNPAQRLYLARQQAERGTCPNDDDFRKAYPTLWEFFTTWWLDDNHRIEAARLQVSVVSGDWLFKLASPSMQGSTQMLASTFSAGLAALEAHVAKADCPWQFWLKRRAAIAKVDPPKNGLDQLNGK